MKALKIQRAQIGIYFSEMVLLQEFLTEDSPIASKFELSREKYNAFEMHQTLDKYQHFFS